MNDILIALKQQRRSKNISLSQAGEMLAEYEGRKKPYTSQYMSYLENADNVSLQTVLKYAHILGMYIIVKEK